MLWCLVFVRLFVFGFLFILKKDFIIIKILKFLVKKFIFIYFNKFIILIKDISKIELYYFLFFWFFGCLLFRGILCGVRIWNDVVMYIVLYVEYLNLFVCFKIIWWNVVKYVVWIRFRIVYYFLLISFVIIFLNFWLCILW